MSNNPIVLYDLKSVKGTGWSLNPWKTRFLLNFKGLDYKTEWLEYPEIKPTLEPHVGPNEQTGTWTIPTVKFPDGSYVMDSRKIVERIEKEHPQPSVHLDSPVLAKLESILPSIMGPLRPIYFSSVPRNILTDASREYWHATRAKVAGMPLDQLEREQGGPQAWDAAKPGLHKVEALLRENPEGPFFLGKTVSYADFNWGGLLIFLERNGVLDKFYETSENPQLHKDLLEALAPYAKRDDH